RQRGPLKQASPKGTWTRRISDRGIATLSGSARLGLTGVDASIILAVLWTVRGQGKDCRSRDSRELDAGSRKPRGGGGERSEGFRGQNSSEEARRRKGQRGYCGQKARRVQSCKRRRRHQADRHTTRRCEP